jgi:hypothetical protein
VTDAEKVLLKNMTEEELSYLLEHFHLTTLKVHWQELWEDGERSDGKMMKVQTEEDLRKKFDEKLKGEAEKLKGRTRTNDVETLNWDKHKDTLMSLQKSEIEAKLNQCDKELRTWEDKVEKELKDKVEKELKDKVEKDKEDGIYKKMNAGGYLGSEDDSSTLDAGFQREASSSITLPLRAQFAKNVGVDFDGGQTNIGDSFWTAPFEKGEVGPEVGIEEFRKNLIGISLEFHRNCMHF